MKDFENMSDRQLLIEMVEEQQRTTKAQKMTEYACIGLAVILLVVSVILVPKAIVTLDNANETLESANATLESANKDLTALESSISGLEGLEKQATEAMENMNSIDFDALNNSIRNLEAIVEPMAKLFKR